uniref:Uncharacterized protein n=1 Tax=Rhizophora mucronata TaxID=61149 RepID=A0A2P2QE49_RHIMU
MEGLVFPHSQPPSLFFSLTLFLSNLSRIILFPAALRVSQ